MPVYITFARVNRNPRYYTKPRRDVLVCIPIAFAIHSYGARASFSRARFLGERASRGVFVAIFHGGPSPLSSGRLAIHQRLIAWAS